MSESLTHCAAYVAAFGSRQSSAQEAKLARNGNPRSHPDIAFPDWQRPLLAALLETDPQKVQQHIFSLEEAIVKRTELLADTPDVEAGDEKFAISVALRTLRVLQVEKLNYPDWNRM